MRSGATPSMTCCASKALELEMCAVPMRKISLLSASLLVERRVEGRDEEMGGKGKEGEEMGGEGKEGH